MYVWVGVGVSLCVCRSVGRYIGLCVCQCFLLSCLYVSLLSELSLAGAELEATQV